MWKIRIERLSLIEEAIEKEKTRLEEELAARGFFALRLRESDLYIVYLKDRLIGPYSIREPFRWQKRDKESLLTLLAVATHYPSATGVYLRGLLAGKDRQGAPVFPAGRFDIVLAVRLATPLPPGHPALDKKTKPAPPVIFYEEIEEE